MRQNGNAPPSGRVAGAREVASRGLTNDGTLIIVDPHVIIVQQERSHALFKLSTSRLALFEMRQSSEASSVPLRVQ